MNNKRLHHHRRHHHHHQLLLHPRQLDKNCFFFFFFFSNIFFYVQLVMIDRLFSFSSRMKKPNKQEHERAKERQTETSLFFYKCTLENVLFIFLYIILKTKNLKCCLFVFCHPTNIRKKKNKTKGSSQGYDICVRSHINVCACVFFSFPKKIDKINRNNSLFFLDY